MISWFKTLRFLKSLGDESRLERADPVSSAKTFRLCSGAACTRYPARSRKKGTILAVQGLTVHGQADKRLVNLALGLAHEHFDVVTLDLPSLYDGTNVLHDVASLRELIPLLADHDGRPVMTVAFSVGAGLLLSVMAEPLVDPCISKGLFVGAYYNLKDVVVAHQLNGSQLKAPGEMSDAAIYYYLSELYRHRDTCHLSEEKTEKLWGILAGYCDSDDLGAKQDQFGQFFDEQTLKALHQRRLSGQQLESISPIGSLSGLTSEIYLIHDEHDDVITKEHSQKIYNELLNYRRDGQQKLLVTSLMSHVSANAKGSVRDKSRLVSIFRQMLC